METFWSIVLVLTAPAILVIIGLLTADDKFKRLLNRHFNDPNH